MRLSVRFLRLVCSFAILVPCLTIPGLAAAAPASAPQSTAQAVVLDRIVAVVNQGVILQSGLANAIALTQAQLRARGITVPPVRDLQGQVLEHMIMTRIQLQRAKLDGIHVDDGEITDAIEHIAQQNHATPSQFMQGLAASGISSAELRKQLRDEITISKVRQKEVDERIHVTDEDIKLFLANQSNQSNDQYHLSHILVALPANATPEQRKKAKDKAMKILDALQHGGDFAQLAIRDSNGQQALKGGDLGWRNAADLPTMFAQLVPTMQVGQVSGVITAANGYNIIKLDDKRSSDQQRKVVENNIQQILLKPNTLRDEAATEAFANKLYAEIKAGADFGKLAQADSDDTQNKRDGGKLGWQPTGAFVPAFQQHVDALQPGQVGRPFETRHGWHIVKLLGRRTTDVTEKVREARARAAIMQRRETENYQTWLQRLRADAYIDIRLKPGMITEASVAAAGHDS